jgi:hypothetical protein
MCLLLGEYVHQMRCWYIIFDDNPMRNAVSPGLKCSSRSLILLYIAYG